jgi:hypothetical protein
MTALLASLVFHVAILALFFGSLKGGPVAGGGAPLGDEAHAMTVSLAGMRGAPRQSQATQSDPLQALFTQIRAEQSTVAASDKPKLPSADAAKLFDVIEPNSKQSDSGRGGAGRARVDQGGHGAVANPNATAQTDQGAKGSGGHTVEGPGKDASAGGLWGEIEPCWSKLPSISSVPVTLEISLSEKGLIAVPPKIIRPSTAAPDEMRLIAEARALAAVTACVPYRAAANAGVQRVFRVEFGASG